MNTIATIPPLRIDRVEIGPSIHVSFLQKPWTVGEIWSACLIPRGNPISVGFEVPDSLVRAGPIYVELRVGGEATTLKVASAGHVFMTSRSAVPVGGPITVTLWTSATWVPRDLDPNSQDTRHLGARISSLGF